MNNQEILQTLESFLPTFTDTVNPLGFMLNVFLAAICSHLLAKLYVRHAKSFSDRGEFARNFLILCLTTTMIITIIKSSLALSLGLVGALSIVRFRTAIKEPEELTFLFVAIGLGVGFGANQTVITLMLFASIVVAVEVRGFTKDSLSPRGYGFAFSSGSTTEVTAENVFSVFEQWSDKFSLKRLERARGSLEMYVWAMVSGPETIDRIQEDLLALDDDARISVFNNEIIFQ